MPPTLGGKSLVTSRWVTGSRLRPGIALDEITSTQHEGRPPGVLDDHLVIDGQPAAQGGLGGRLGAVANVAQGHQGVTTEIAGMAFGDVPTAVARHELVVGGTEEVEEVDPRFAVGLG